MLNQEMARSAHAMYKAAFPKQNRSWYMLSITYQDVTMLELDHDMIFHPHLMQLASILPPPSGHHQCDMSMTVTIQPAEAHIVFRCRDGIHLMMVYFADVTLANSNHDLWLESTLYKHTYEMAGIF